MVETLTADRAALADRADRAATLPTAPPTAPTPRPGHRQDSRWMVGIGMALVAAILITMLDLRADVNGLTDDMTGRPRRPHRPRRQLTPRHSAPLFGFTTPLLDAYLGTA